MELICYDEVSDFKEDMRIISYFNKEVKMKGKKKQVVNELEPTVKDTYATISLIKKEDTGEVWGFDSISINYVKNKYTGSLIYSNGLPGFFDQIGKSKRKYTIRVVMGWKERQKAPIYVLEGSKIPADRWKEYVKRTFIFQLNGVKLKTIGTGISKDDINAEIQIKFTAKSLKRCLDE